MCFNFCCSFLLPPWRELKCLAGMGCSPHPHRSSSLAPYTDIPTEFHQLWHPFDCLLGMECFFSTLASSSWASSSRHANCGTGTRMVVLQGLETTCSRLSWDVLMCLDSDYCRCCFLEGYSGITCSFEPSHLPFSICINLIQTRSFWTPCLLLVASTGETAFSTLNYTSLEGLQSWDVSSIFSSGRREP